MGAALAALPIPVLPVRTVAGLGWPAPTAEVPAGTAVVATLTRATLTTLATTLTGWPAGAAFGAILIARPVTGFRLAAVCAATGPPGCGKTPPRPFTRVTPAAFRTAALFAALIILAVIRSAVAEGFPISHGTIPLVMS
ncbi:hypothetical protein GCM10009784_24100 [Arthrobacter parietis]|uniref:MFS transporter n=1 Tax=Arthrobacter parietis TaxID=271434 RepID=A0ABP5MPU6_9MICC